MSSNVSEIKEEIIDKEDLMISSNANEMKQFYDAEEKYNVKDEESVICDLIFVSKTDVDLDYLLIDETIIDKFQCITCNNFFLDIQSLNQHSIICGLKIDNLTQKCVTCKFCDEIYISMRSLQLHITAVHGEKKHFKCDICKATFSHKTSLKRHVAAIHEGKNTFKCDECDARFNYNLSLNRHVASVHEGKKPFKCDECGVRFTQKSSLKKHNTAIHEGKKDFKCARCKATFISKANLNRHVAAIHEGKKPFKCKVCDNRFAQKKMSVESTHCNSA